MSYPVPPPPGHLPAGNVDRSKPLDTPGNEFFGLESQHGPAPPFKRRRNQDDHTQDSASHSQQNPLLNIGTGNIFYKTRLCAKFEGGNCSNGKKCTFAHGFEDLHEPPPNWKENVYANGKGTHRGMKLCRNFIFEKECPFGEKCNFLHLVPCNTEMARALPINISAASTETTGPMLEQRNDTGHTRLNKHLTCPDAFLVDRKFASLKTKMCAKWESTGQCPSKGNCHYAHGQSELVTPRSQNMSSLTKNTSISIKNFRLPLNSGGPPNEAAAPAKVTEVNKSLNWRPPRKIVGIYGDWLDGYSLPDNN